MNLCPGDILAMRYKVKRRIGGGSFGEIYIGKTFKKRLSVATDTRTQLEVAIKTVRNTDSHASRN
jgi:hypothetical protein